MGRARRLTGVASTVEMTSCSLSVFSISLTRRAGRTSVAMKVVTRHTRMPVAEIIRGYLQAGTSLRVQTRCWARALSRGACAVHPPRSSGKEESGPGGPHHMATSEGPREDTDEMTRAAHVDSANEPNRSAPMPAMAPPSGTRPRDGDHISGGRAAARTCDVAHIVPACTRHGRERGWEAALTRESCRKAGHREQGRAAVRALGSRAHPVQSAMTAGLRGSSSGMSFSILPTRSAPTSAALV